MQKLLFACFPKATGTTIESSLQKALTEQVPVFFEAPSTVRPRLLKFFVYPSQNGLAVFYRDITERKQLERELEAQRRRTTAAVLQAQEQERQEIGKELHDNINQILTTVKLYLEVSLSPGMDRDELTHKSIELLQDSINEIRCLSKRLASPAIEAETLSLPHSLKALVDHIAATNRFKVILDTTALTNRVISKEVHLAVYRIVQEQLTNVLKHAEAGTVSIVFQIENENLIMTLTDDGKGFDRRQSHSGIGIANMEARAKKLRGTLKIISKPGKGCRLILQLPVEAHPYCG